jgi:hypothetical protein
LVDRRIRLKSTDRISADSWISSVVPLSVSTRASPRSERSSAGVPTTWADAFRVATRSRTALNWSGVERSAPSASRKPGISVLLLGSIPESEYFAPDARPPTCSLPIVKEPICPRPR